MGAGHLNGLCDYISFFHFRLVVGGDQKPHALIFTKIYLAEGHILSTSSLIHMLLEDIDTLWCFPRMV